MIPKQILKTCINLIEYEMKYFFVIFYKIVISHYFHLVNYELGEAHLVCSSWLQKALSYVHNSEQRLDTQENSIESEDDALEYDNSFTIPTIVSASTFMEDEKIGQQEANQSFAGIDILYDPLIGHFALARLLNGETKAIDLTMHSKLFEVYRSKEVAFNY